MFRNTFGQTLRRRLYPNTALHPKQLADALGRDTQSIYNWMNSRNAPDGEAIQACVEFFSSTGDHAFIVEIFPGITPLIQRKKEADDALTLLQGIARLAAGVAA